MSDDKRTKIGAIDPSRVSPGTGPSPVIPAQPAAPHGTPPPVGQTPPASSTEVMDPNAPPPVPAGTAPHHGATSYLPPMAPQGDPLLGQVLAGRYAIEKKLGEGGMGAVYLATHTVLEKQVALKVLHNEFARKADLVERFMQEAKAASRIRHENVIDISDFGATPEGLVFFAMELLKGHDLHEDIARARLAGQLLPYARSKRIFLQICAALSAAHARGIVHRDLKPENVYLVEFLDDPDFVKLLDFGIAKLTEVNEEGRKLTRTGMLFGTPEYMSPEQAKGEPVDHRVDIYAMGCILFQLLTGRVPFEADNFMGVLSLHLTEQPPVIPDAVFDRVGAPRALAQIIDKALAKNRDDRWQSIDEFANAVRVASGDAPIDRSTTGGMTAQRAASVPAPAVTKEARTPTPPPAGPVTPVPAVGDARQRTQWTGNLTVPEAGPEAPKRSKLPLALGAIAVVGIVAVVAFVVASKDHGGDGTASGSAPGSGSQVAVAGTPDASAVTVPAPGAIDAPAAPALPEWSELTLTSEPPGAEIVDVSTKKRYGKTPKVLRVPGSAAAVPIQFTMRGYESVTVDLTPDRDKLAHNEVLVKKGGGPITRPPPNTGSGSATPVATGSGSGSAVTAPPPVPKDAGVVAPPPPIDDCPELPCAPKAFCKGDAQCGDGGKCVAGKCIKE